MEIVFWIGFCGLVSYFANKKGRNTVGWFILAFIFSPLLAGIALAMTKDLKVEEDLSQVRAENQNLKDRVVSNEKLTDYRLGRAESDISRLRDANNQPSLSNSQQQSRLLSEDTKFCYACKEVIKASAIKCKHCGTMLDNLKTIECKFCSEEILATDKICRHCNSAVAV
jgi:hypothetical protein